MWGIPVAVFGTRFVLPVLIVAGAAGLSPLFVAQLAFFDPVQYGEHLEAAHTAIAGFGSAFLLMVSLKYFFNDKKKVHWIAFIERRLSRWGGVEAIEIALVLAVLLASSFIVPEEAATLLFSGLVGAVLFIVIEGIAQSFEVEAGSAAAAGGAAVYFWLHKRAEAPPPISGPTEKPQDTGGGPGPKGNP